MQDSNVATLRSVCVVRPARPCDCEAMAELAGQLGYECTGEEIQERLGHMQDPNCYAVLVAEVPEGRIAGWIGAYLNRSVVSGSRAEINGLVVEQQVRSRGIGETLLHAAEEWGRSIGCDTISVRSNVNRDRAHRFYANNGYENVKTQKEFRKDL